MHLLGIELQVQVMTKCNLSAKKPLNSNRDMQNKQDQGHIYQTVLANNMAFFFFHLTPAEELFQ